MLNTPHPYLDHDYLMFCPRCDRLDRLWMIDRWQPLCPPCARSAARERIHSTAWLPQEEAA